jgi:hypothetical protein
MAKFPELVEFIVNLVLEHGPSVSILCVGYGQCDLLQQSCDWAVVKALASWVARRSIEVPPCVHFYDSTCTDATPHVGALERELAPINVRVCESEADLLERYDFVLYFGAFEDDDFGLQQTYESRTTNAFVHVRIPGFGMITNEGIEAAGKLFMERHGHAPPARVPLDPRVRALALEMQDRPFAFVRVYRAEQGWAREMHRFFRVDTSDDKAFEKHIGDYDYWRVFVGGGRSKPCSSIALLATTALFSILGAL